jgi:hypothetical protein
MTEINPDVMAQLHRIHSAVNDGTVDKDAINDALRRLHDYLTGAAYKGVPIGPDEPDAAEHDVGGEEPAHKAKPRKKR